MKNIKYLLCALALVSNLACGAKDFKVLSFHDIVQTMTATSEPDDVTADNLINYFSWLKANGYTVVSIQDVINAKNGGKSLPNKAIVLTFDDGYKSAHNNLMEILPEIEQRYGKKIKIVFFINPGFMGKEGNYNHATCEDLRQGYSQGYYDLQSHGQNHENLTQISLLRAQSELSRAQKDLKACVGDLDNGKEVANHFAYPFGATNDEVAKLTAKYYQSSYLYNSHALHPLHDKDKYRLSRFTVNRETSLHKLQAQARGSWF